MNELQGRDDESVYACIWVLICIMKTLVNRRWMSIPVDSMCNVGDGAWNGDISIAFDFYTLHPT